MLCIGFFRQLSASHRASLRKLESPFKRTLPSNGLVL
jgi:hypothetical protein